MLLKTWWITLRPKTLTASILPLGLGLSFAYRKAPSFSLLHTLFVVLCVLFVQIIVNLLNDYFDVKKGTDEKKETGRGLQTGKLTFREVRNASILLIFLTLLMVIYLSYEVTPILFPIALLSLLCAYLYTGGPYPLAYNALGDAFVFVFFGPVAVFSIAIVYFQSSVLKMVAPLGLLGLISGFLGVCLLVTNNLRDWQEDKSAKKHTLVVLLGERFGQLEFSLCFLCAYIAYFFFDHYFQGGKNFLPFLGLIHGGFLLYWVFVKKKNELNFLLAQTSLNMLLFAVLFCSGGFMVSS